MKYRPEIDGLRAIAVISVILFHAGFKTFEGGYIGVDIFFVISGYLITRIILKDLKQNTFSLSTFYKRRARRVLPPLFMMIFITSFIYFIFISPSKDEIMFHGQSILSSVLFYSNILFPLNEGYFTQTSELSLYVHTWSLSVEEQFYLIYPLLFLFLFRNEKKIILSLLIFISIISITFAQVGTLLFEKWNFFLLPSRSWQLAIGAICALINPKNERFKDILSKFGLLLILLAIFNFEESTSVPSFPALIPVLGTALVLTCSSSKKSLFNPLTNSILVGVGMISYGAYLWHQPIFAILKHLSFHPKGLPVESVWFGIILTLVFATLSYLFIEAPKKRNNIRVKTLTFSSLLLILLALFMESIYRLSPKLRSENFSSNVQDLAKIDYLADKVDHKGYHFGKVSEKKPDALLLGDSHARMLIPNISEELKKLNLYGFHPFSKDLNNDFFRNDDQKILEEAYELAKQAKVTIISIRSSTGRDNFFYDKEKISYDLNFLSKFESRLNKLKSVSKKIVIIGPVPESPYWAPNVGRSYIGKQYTSKLSEFLKLQSPYLELLTNFQNINPSVKVIFPHIYLTSKDGKFLNHFKLSSNDESLPLYYDDDHLNSFGSKEIVKEIFK